MSEWISVSDRLPEEFTDVLVCEQGLARLDYAVSYRIGGIWFVYWVDPPMANVTHWQPLPEPPDVGDSTE